MSARHRPRSGLGKPAAAQMHPVFVNKALLEHTRIYSFRLSSVADWVPWWQR